MQFVMELFIVVAVVALIVQVGILIALFLQLKKTTESMNRVVSDLHTRVGPIITRTQLLLDDTQPKISAMVEDASQMVYLARSQAQKFDRVLAEAADRLRGQLVRADRIVTGTLEAVEDAGTHFHRSLWGPVQKASAVLQGLKVGIDVLRSRRSSSASAREREAVEAEDEELFI